MAHLEPNPLYTYRFTPVVWGVGSDWFDGGLGKPERAAWGGKWSPGVEITNGEISLDGVDEDGACFSIDAPHRIARGGCIAKVSAVMTFGAGSGLMPLDAGVKGAITMHDGSYWCVCADSDGGATNVWRRLDVEGVTARAGVPVSVTCTVFRRSGRNLVEYEVDGHALGTFDIVLSGRAISFADFDGLGVVSSLTGTCDGDTSAGTSVSLR